MVYEFPELQGHVGHLLAKLEGEDLRLLWPLKNIILPTFSGDNLPATKEGLVLAFADRWDTSKDVFHWDCNPKVRETLSDCDVRPMDWFNYY